MVAVGFAPRQGLAKANRCGDETPLDQHGTDDVVPVASSQQHLSGNAPPTQADVDQSGSQ